MAGSSISPIKNLYRSGVQVAVNLVPKVTVKSERVEKTIGWIGEKISSPQNRFILGASAIISQPFIDLHNKKVDEDTRKVSAARTSAKIIAGTTTGVIIRSACIRAIDEFTKMPTEITENMKFKNLRKFFTPSQEAIKKLNGNLGQYKKSLGTILAVVVMMFTNFLIDAPLTKLLTNRFIDKIKKDDAAKTPNNKEVAHE